MSAEGDFIVAIRADPRDNTKRVIATADISNVTTGQALNWTATPSDRMSFVGARALKVGKISAIASQVWTGNLSGCGEGKSTGATKTYLYKVFLTDKTIKDFNDPFEAGRALGVSAETQRCLEIGSNPQIIDLPLDPENVIVQHIDASTFDARYSKLNLKTGKSSGLFKDTGDKAIGLIDPRDGKVRVQLKTDSKGDLNYDAETYILNPTTGNFDLEAPLTVDFKNRNQMDVVDYDEETGKYFVVTDKFSDHAAVYLYDARTDKFDAEPLFAHKDFNATGIVLGTHKSDFGKILGFHYAGADVTTYWTDPDLAAIQRVLEGSFKGQMVFIRDFTDDRNKILFAVESPRNAPSYYLLLNKKTLVGIGAERPWIKPGSLGERSLVYYDARDGLKIPGFLTLPPGFKKGDPAPPAIVMPHGGPWARDYELTVAMVERAGRRAHRHVERPPGRAARRRRRRLRGPRCRPSSPGGSGGYEGDLAASLVLVRDAIPLRRARRWPPLREVRRGRRRAGFARRQARADLDLVHDVAERLVGPVELRRRVALRRTAPRPGAAGGAAPRSAGCCARRCSPATRSCSTSATMTLGASFEPLARSLGLGAGPGARGPMKLEGPAVGRARRRLAIRVRATGHPLHRAPPPAARSRRAHRPVPLDELAGLVEAGGGARSACSSRRSVRRCRRPKALASRLDLPIMSQWDDSLPELIRQFAEEPEDVPVRDAPRSGRASTCPGTSCSLVVIDRIPFPRPDDPLVAARAEEGRREQAETASWPCRCTRAALLLAQGVGRLIRSDDDDRGVVAVLDSRLATAGYGGFLRASLPPFWWTTDREQAREDAFGGPAPTPACRSERSWWSDSTTVHPDATSFQDHFSGLAEIPRGPARLRRPPSRGSPPVRALRARVGRAFGNGQAARAVAAHFERVVATDASADADRPRRRRARTSCTGSSRPNAARSRTRASTS